MMRYNALEIEFIDSLIVLIEFPKKDEGRFIKFIDGIRQERILAHGQKFKANRVAVFDNGWWCDNSGEVVSELTEKWKRREISNLTYLCKLNVMASRSGRDLSQYPVVPWIAELTQGK